MLAAEEAHLPALTFAAVTNSSKSKPASIPPGAFSTGAVKGDGVALETPQTERFRMVTLLPEDPKLMLS